VPCAVRHDTERAGDLVCRPRTGIAALRTLRPPTDHARFV